MSDFMSEIGADAFNPKVPEGFSPPELRRDPFTPTVPAIKELYAVQSNILRSLNSDTDEGTEHYARQAYKTLNRWLREHGGGS